ncbi:MAG: asparagine synthase (glutamine-hydrolyzing), partial [Candidatus Omnitrophica bacterium]|nr:asparagine synthase (glutamine-hydrolyzing) [Candidatus Omnitrophota bacterium]
MCGIAGYIGKSPVENEAITETLKLMRNRGPDHRDFVNVKDGSVNIALLHSRLSIIDLNERSNQPFTIGDYTIVYNGEIYNYVELKKELKKRGVNFRTTSDVEVLLQYYIMFGEECVKDFEGMWSFVIYDKRNKKLFLSRDRFAEKPIYILRMKDGIFFGSEVKFIRSLSREHLVVNMDHLFRYLVNGYKSIYKTKETFFKGIEEVPYATNMVIGHDLNPVTYRYWSPTCQPEKMGLNDAIEGFRHRLFESVKIRLRADVPLAFCLSGGIDSGALASIAKKIFNYDVATFSIIDADERYNEYENIQKTINDLNCKHTILHVPQDIGFERLEKLVRYHDSPVYTISYYIHSFLSEVISKKGYKVAVSGTAADELVTGYYDHFILHLYEMRGHPEYSSYLNDWETNIKKFVRNPYLKNPNLYFDNPQFRDHIYLDNKEFAKYLKPKFNEPFQEKRYCDSLLRNRMLNELFHESIPVILHEDDLNSMFYS